MRATEMLLQRLRQFGWNFEPDARQDRYSEPKRGTDGSVENPPAPIRSQSAATPGPVSQGRDSPEPPNGPDPDVVPLSLSQERLWLLGQMDQRPGTFNDLLVFRLDGPLDTERLHQAFVEITQRHDILRSTFLDGEDGPEQTIHVELPMEHSAIDLSVLPEHGRGARLDQLIRQESCREFDPCEGPPLRYSLVRLNTDQHAVLLTVHGLVCDGWSLSVLRNELAEIYNARVSGTRPRLAARTRQYADYAAWQRSLPEAVVEHHEEYWKAMLSSELQPLQLPTRHPRPDIPSYSPSRVTRTFGPDLLAKLTRFTELARCDLLSVMCTAFAIMLHRYARQQDIVFGTTLSNRGTTPWDRAVGPFANPVPLRLSIDDRSDVKALLRSVVKEVHGAREHADIPLELLIQNLPSNRDPSRLMPFDVLLEVQEAATRCEAFGESRLTMLDASVGLGKYDLSVYVDPVYGLLTATFNVNLFDAFVVEQMLRHFEAALRCIADAPGRIHDLSLLRPDEVHLQLHDWNARTASYPTEGTLHALFEEQAARTPDAVAVVSGEEHLTYLELDKRANRLARYLTRYGVGPDELVAICLDKGPDLLVSILAVLKSGAAYLPLDPEHPQERIRFLVEDARARLLITSSHLRGDTTHHVGEVILVDQEWDAIRSMPCSPPAIASAPSDLAYCIYTSGSMGRPKGILVEHRQVVSLVMCDNLPFDFRSQDVWTMFHSSCFDFSVWEIFGALLHGGRLVLVPPELTRDPALFVDLLAAQRVTVLNLTPTGFSLISQEAIDRGTFCPTLRYIVFGGEKLHPNRLAEFRSRFPAVRLVNMYGITEATVHATYHEVTEEDIVRNVSNIGRPLPTTTVYIVDEDLRLLPVGVPGELCVGGSGIARGYLNRPDQSECRFVSSPFHTGDRLLRTGDLAKYLPNGELVYIGRNDDQIQIRGYRVEPGEVKGVLTQHPAISAVEVVSQTSDSGSCIELVAYCVMDDDTSSKQLRRYLAERLPAYMIPTHIVALSALPITTNGKVDRASLQQRAPHCRAVGPSPERAALKSG